MTEQELKERLEKFNKASVEIVNRLQDELQPNDALGVLAACTASILTSIKGNTFDERYLFFQNSLATILHDNFGVNIHVVDEADLEVGRLN